MDAHTFLAEFGHIANAPGGVGQLRQMILHLGVTGQLTERVASDQNADEIIAENAKVRAQLVRRREMKRRADLPPLKANDAPWPLPEGWRWVRLGDFTNFGDASKVTLDDVEPDTWVVELEDIEKTSSRILARIKVEDRKFKSQKNRFAAGSILYGKLRPYLDKVIIADEPGVCSTEIAPISFFHGMDSRYLRWYLKSPYFVRHATESAYGMNLPRFGTEAALATPLPVPPTHEQQRLVAKIDELMSLCDDLESGLDDRRKLRQKLARATVRELSRANDSIALTAGWPALERIFGAAFNDAGDIEELRGLCLDLAIAGHMTRPHQGDQSATALCEQVRRAKQRLVDEGAIPRRKPVLAKSFEGEACPSHWRTLSLDEMISTIDAGWSPACLASPRRQETSWGILRTTAVQRLKFIPEEHKELPAHLVPRPAYQIARGDILITRAGPKNRVGICCVVDRAPPRLMISDKIIRIHIVEDLIDPRFVALSLSAGAPGRMLEEMKSGMAESQMNISQEKLRSITIPVPPQAEQLRILKLVDSLLDKCDQLAELLELSVDRAARLAATAVSSLTGIAQAEEEEPLKAPQTELVAPVRIGESPDVKAQAPLAAILVRQGGALAAKDLWQRFGGEIDDFYAQLKTEVAHGWIIEPEPATMLERDAA